MTKTLRAEFLAAGGAQAGQQPANTAKPAPKRKSERDESWRELLDKADWPLFNRMREWRGERSCAEGIPPYVVSNNRELAALVKRRPTTPTPTLPQLAELDGFGDAKPEKYAADRPISASGCGFWSGCCRQWRRFPSGCASSLRTVSSRWH